MLELPKKANFTHAVAGFVLASMYFVYMLVLLPRM